MNIINNHDMSKKSAFIHITIAAMLVLVAFVVRSNILGNNLVTLASAAPLTGQVAQVLGPDSQGSLLQAEKDFSLSTTYFDNKRWAVTIITPIGDAAFDRGILVLQEKENVYQVVLGPGGTATAGQINSLPKDVATYVSSIISVYQPLPD